jgi:hypothetical protein
LVLLALAPLVGGPAEASSASAAFAVSVTVEQSCTVRVPMGFAVRDGGGAASCSDGAPFAAAVTRETVTTDDAAGLTGSGEKAQASLNYVSLPKPGGGVDRANAGGATATHDNIAVGDLVATRLTVTF